MDLGVIEIFIQMCQLMVCRKETNLTLVLLLTTSRKIYKRDPLCTQKGPPVHPKDNNNHLPDRRDIFVSLREPTKKTDPPYFLL